MQAHPRRVGDQVDRAPAAGVDARLVGDEADRVASEHHELLLDQQVEPGQDALGRQYQVLRRALGRGRVGRGSARDRRIARERRLEELGAHRRGEPRP